MSDFDDVADQYDPHAVEERVTDRWDAVDAYERTVEHRSDGEDFYFLDGPPYTSGAAHMGTTWNKILKDAHVRYLRMCGYDVYDRPGYDMHGLPIETQVEEELGFENKQDIEAFGEEAFIEECKEYAEDQLEGLQSDFQSFGVWLDWDDPYRTVDPEYMEAAWWGFQRAHERGLVEQGMRSINQCPRCETAIANNEVERHDVHKPAIYVRFPLADREGSLVIWTTTPWTVPANTFVAVDGDATYVKVRATGGPAAADASGAGADAASSSEDGEHVLYVSAQQAEEVVSEAGYDDYEVEAELAGEELVGWAYDHPLAAEVPEHPQGDGAGQVYTAEYADAEDRSGMVHSAPGHGEEDFERGQELDLEVFCPVGPDGRFTDAGGAYAGTFVRDANDDVIADLEERGLLLAHDPNHLVEGEGQCWRCDTDIVRIVTDQWFVTVTDVKEELLANVEESEWYPQTARDERFRDFVEDSPDWNVSRQRYWGIPIPIWTCADDACEHLNVIGTREELAERVHQDVDPDDVDLHKPTVDPLTMDCADCGAEATRVPDVFDVWLDSSVASWATLGYPGDEEQFEELWPADLIVEAHDQTRGWFWSQLGMGTTALGEIPYRDVLVHGWALMPDGRAMSKSKDILVDPNEVIDEYGVDPMRAFLLSVTPQLDDMKFSYEGVETRQRELNILWNVFRFPLPYMELDGFDPADAALLSGDGAARDADGAARDADGVARDAVEAIADDLTTVDRWLLARVQSVVDEVEGHWDAYEQHKALEAILEFVVEDLSRFYVQVVRERMWEDADSDEKLAAYETLTYALHRVVALLAPFVPHLADEIYGSLTGDAGHPTVHMLDYPTVDDRWTDEQLEADVAALRAVEEAGSNARQQAERKLRWPVTRVVVAADDEAVHDAVERHRELVADRLNAREVELVAPGEQWAELRYSAEADMGELGPAFGDRAHDVMHALNDARVESPAVEAFAAALREEGILEPDDEFPASAVEPVTEPPSDVSGAVVDREGAELGVVYVDTGLDRDVESEGYAREVIRRVQEMRKELALDVDEPIRLEYAVDDDRVADLVAEHDDLIAEEVRAEEVGAVDDGHRKTWDVEDVAVEIAIVPVAEAAA